MISVTNDLVADNRVHKVSNTLTDMGFGVVLIGRKLPGSQQVEERRYSTRRFRLPFIKGPLFYACFNIRLFLFLLFSKFDVLLSNDLDTLPANYIASRIKNKPLVYDSHEYFTEVPELVNRPIVRRIWEWMEGVMVPQVDEAYTVCDSIAAIYSEKYRKNFHVIRNVPYGSVFRPVVAEGQEKPLILYQGALNVGRGLNQAIMAMHYLNNIRLVIAGDGNLRKDLEQIVASENLSDKVEFLGKLPINKLAEITSLASVGLSLEEDIGLNYRYALPNKLFDYIQARVPVLVSDLPEMAGVVRNYNIGEVASGLNPRRLADVLEEMIYNSRKRKVWINNLEKASQELVWEKEENILKEIFTRFA